MYHPSRGGVRGGRDQFNWEDVKSDKHKENYIGHSVKAPVGRWQKGKDLMWYARDNKRTPAEAAASAREEIERVKQEEEVAIREALGLAPRRDKKPQGSRLDKREQEELFKRTKTGEDAGKPYAEGERIEGLGFAPAPKQEAPDKKDLLPKEAAGEGPLVQIIAHKVERVRKGHGQVIVTQEEVTGSVSDEHAKKRKRKEEKRAAKERRREEKRAAKQARREKRNRHDSISSDEEPTKVADKETSPATRKGRHHDSDSSGGEHDQVVQGKYSLQIDHDTGGKPSMSKGLSRMGHQRSIGNHGSDDNDEDAEWQRKNHKNCGAESTRRRESSPLKDQRNRTDHDLEDIRGRPTISKVVEKVRVGHVRDSARRYNDTDEHSDEGVGRRTSSSKVQNGEDHHWSRRGNEIPRSDTGFKGKQSSSRRPFSQREERERRHSGSLERENSPRRVHGSYHGERSRKVHTDDREGKCDDGHRNESIVSRKRHDSDTSEDMSQRHEGRHERPSRVQPGQEVFNKREDKDLSRASNIQSGYQKRSCSPVQREAMRRRRHDSDSD